MRLTIDNCSPFSFCPLVVVVVVGCVMSNDRFHLFGGGVRAAAAAAAAPWGQGEDSLVGGRLPDRLERVGGGLSSRSRPLLMPTVWDGKAAAAAAATAAAGR